MDAPYRCSGGASEGSIRLSLCCRATGICVLIFYRRSRDIFDNMLCEWPVELICENFADQKLYSLPKMLSQVHHNL